MVKGDESPHRMTAVSIVFAQAIVCGIAIAPAVFMWSAVVRLTPRRFNVAAVCREHVPCAIALLLFALCLMPVSALMTHARWRADALTGGTRISEMSWTLAKWAATWRRATSCAWSQAPSFEGHRSGRPICG